MSSSSGALRIQAVHTPGHRPEHTCFLLSDLRRGGEPWAVLTGRQPVRRRRRTTRPGGRAHRGRARHLPLAARPSADASGLRRGLAGPPRRLDVRRPRHGPQGRLDDRLRAAPQPDAGDRGRAGVRRRVGREARRPAPELQGDRRAQPRSAADRRHRASPACSRASSRSGSSAGRSSSMSVPTSSSPTVTFLGRSRSRCTAAASEPSSRGSAPDAEQIVFVGRDDEDGAAGRRSWPRRSAWPTVLAPVGCSRAAGRAGTRRAGRRHRLSRVAVEEIGPAPGGRSARAGPGRARGRRVRGRSHPGLDQRALARHRRRFPPASTRDSPDAGDLRLRPARPAPRPACCSRFGATDVIHVARRRRAAGGLELGGSLSDVREPSEASALA